MEQNKMANVESKYGMEWFKIQNQEGKLVGRVCLLVRYQVEMKK